jgi:hypothetical protein
VHWKNFINLIRNDPKRYRQDGTIFHVSLRGEKGPKGPRESTSKTCPQEKTNRKIDKILRIKNGVPY